MKLRPYQSEAVREVIQAFCERKRPIVELPTGSGKTVIFAELTRRLTSGRALVLVHRKELKEQAIEKIKAVEPAFPVDVKTVQYVKYNLISLRPAQYSLIIIDECHRAASHSYQRILEYFECKCVVGFTATAYRNEGGKYTEDALVGENKPFSDIVYQKPIGEMIESGYLVKPRAIRIQTETDLTGVRKQAGDYAPGELSAVIDNEARNRLIVEKWKEYASGRATIAFCATVEHAKNLAAAFEKARIESACIYGAMPAQERNDEIAAYLYGITEVLTTVGVLTEGFDAPETACVIMARPTKSPILFTQCIGRGLRLAPEIGKDECLVLDFSDSSKRHRLDDVHIGDVYQDSEESVERKGSKPGDDDRLMPLPPPAEQIAGTKESEEKLLDPNRAPSNKLKWFLVKHGQWIDGITHAEAVKINRRLRAQGAR